jgi:hypothetical protein
MGRQPVTFSNIQDRWERNASSGFTFKTFRLGAAVRDRACKSMTWRMMRFELDIIPLPLHVQMKRTGLNATTHNDGDARLDAIQKDLDRFTLNGVAINRNKGQRGWHRHMLLALMRNIYGPYFRSAIKRIQAKFHVQEIRRDVLISAGRVNGKTFAVAMMLAMVLLHCPNIEVVVFASGLRLAMEMLLKVRRFIEGHPNGVGRIIERHSSVLTLRVRGPVGRAGAGKDVRALFALPSKADTVRGLHKNVIVIDEFTFSKAEVFMEAILPMTQRDEVTLIGISTPKGRNNIFSKLLTFVDTRKTPPRLMYNVILSGRVCEDCRKKKQADKCTHMDAELPEWIDPQRAADMKQVLLSSMGSNALYVNEALGEMGDTEPPAFDIADIEAMFANVPRGMTICNNSVSAIYLSCDTNGPGKCELAFVGVADKCGRFEVCLLASTPGKLTGGVDGDKIFTQKVFTALAKRYPGTIIVFIPEANYAKEASHLEDYIKHMPNVVTMAEVGSGFYGVRKDNFVTFEMKNLLARLMHDRQIFIAQDLIGIPADAIAHECGFRPESPEAAQYMQAQLKQQLYAMRYCPIKTLKEGTKAEFTIHGKGAGENDDLAVAFMMWPYWRQIFHGSVNSTYLAARSRMPMY